MHRAAVADQAHVLPPIHSARIASLAASAASVSLQVVEFEPSSTMPPITAARDPNSMLGR